MTNYQRWADDAQRVTVDRDPGGLGMVRRRGTVTAYHPASVTVQLDDGGSVVAAVEQVSELPATDEQAETDEAVVVALGGGAAGRGRLAALRTRGFDIRAARR